MKFKKMLFSTVLGISATLLTLSNVVLADSSEKVQYQELTLEQKEKAKQKIKIDKYKIVKKSELGIKEGYDADNPEADWVLGDTFGSPKGTNSIPFTNFAPGDIVVVHDGDVAWGYYRHAGVWDGTYYNGSLDSYAFIEANVENEKGDGNKNVHYSKARKFRNYDKAVGLYVPSISQPYRTAARNRMQQYISKPYKFVGSYKHDTTSFYCSKLPWKAYYDIGGRDLDSNGGTYVYPDDLYQDDHTTIFATGS